MNKKAAVFILSAGFALGAVSASPALADGVPPPGPVSPVIAFDCHGTPLSVLVGDRLVLIHEPALDCPAGSNYSIKGGKAV